MNIPRVLTSPMSAGMLSNPSALFLCTSYWADAIGADSQRIRFCYYCPAWVSLRMKVWKPFRWVWSSEGLWSVLFQKSLELSHDELLNFDRCWRCGWCQTVWSGQNCTVLIIHKRRGSSHVIELLKRAWPHVLLRSGWKKNLKTTDMEVKTCWWMSHDKSCFSYASGNKTFPKRGIGRLLKEWRSKSGRKCLKCELYPAGSFYMGVLRPEISLLIISLCVLQFTHLDNSRLI